MLLAVTVILGAMAGCSGNSIPDAQPKNTDPNAKPRVTRKGLNTGGAATKTAGAIQD
jgi:hypothetical protein